MASSQMASGCNSSSVPPLTDKGMKFSAGLRRKKLVSVPAALAMPLCVSAQLQQTDPYNGRAASGATGLQPASGPDTESVSNHAEQGKPLQFRSQTTIVQVPVVVTDKAGNHIHGLTKADFKVLENGKPQKIASFEEIIPAGTHAAVCHFHGRHIHQCQSRRK